MPSKTKQKIIHSRINITLPERTIELIDRVIEKGDFPKQTVCDRSQFINEAVQYYTADCKLMKYKNTPP
ncbi:MAG: ribbon-helix-helix domain-containing protein [Nostoc sp.]|uniref:ribbon-helix-helix domain-containing protein n=1 Tax=Nostoc sp. TaxID=1180 RepID=UPI002FF53B96